jgi:hypothetical protein
MSYILATYSEAIGTTIEAVSKTAILDVLSLLPDNTSKEITPKDVRDAILSTWETSAIRYTTNGTDAYIGVDRGDVKDIKLLLGKKEISGSTILSNILTGNDTDIFLYNFKSDSDVTQDLKISLLSGTSSSLFSVAPYFKSSYVSSFGGYLSLDIVNPSSYGTINIQSGSSASININNLNWPSPNYITDVTTNPSNASASTSSDLFLVVRSGNSLELTTYQSNGGNLGTPGSPTNIYGNPVQLNGYDLEYTNIVPTIATFGGISLGSTFSNVPLTTMLTAMLYPNYPPISTLVITNTSDGALSYNNSLERRHGTTPITITYTYTLTKLTNNITSTNFSLIRNLTAIVPGGGWPTTTLSGSGLVTQTYPGNTVNIPGTTIGAFTGKSVFTFSVSPNDGTYSSTSSTSFEVVYPYFYGFSSTSSNSQATTQAYAMAETTKRIDVMGSQSLALSGSGYLHFIYPSSYGTLSNILDGNNFIEYTHGSSGNWTYSIQTLNSPTDPSAYWASANFYVYRKKLETTIPPSQIYKFNF